MTKQRQLLFNRAVGDIRKFCIVNRLKMPKIYIDSSIRYPNWRGWYLWGSDEIHIQPDSCVPAALKPGYSWHYPRYFIDMSIYGVVCHEFGHYVHYKSGIGDKRPRFKNELCVSRYEVNNLEKIAEAVRLFVSNPDLLRKANPARYAFLTEVMGIKPATNQHWHKRLGKNTHPKYIVQCNKRIAKASNRV